MKKSAQTKVPFIDLSFQQKSIQAELDTALRGIFHSQKFILGEYGSRLEEKIAAKIRSRYAVGVANGSDALYLALLALGVGPGDEVITTPFTFISSAWGISYVGAKPVFADVEEDTYNLDPAKIAAAITPKTKGIIVVHLFGQPARMNEIMAVAKQHNLFVIEDCAQAVGARYQGAPVGLLGDAGTFSF